MVCLIMLIWEDYKSCKSNNHDEVAWWSDNSDMYCSPHGEHQFSCPRPVKLCLDQTFVQFLFRTI
jgi:hypothetical protein